MLDRTQSPLINNIDNLKLPRPTVYHLDNGIPLYAINLGTQDVLKMEIIFAAGRPYEEKQLVARATASLLKEGTQHYSSSLIAERIDYYGCTLNIPFNLDYSSIILYSLNKYFEKVLPIISEMLAVPRFAPKELSAFIERRQQQLQVDLTKNDVVAYRKITEYIFGTDHPYGYNSFPETYQALERTDLIKHFEKCYTTGNCQIILSGKVSEKEISTINQFLGNTIKVGPKKQIKLPAAPQPVQKVKIQHPETLQTAIRIGRRLFTRDHPDYQGLYVLNAILGGYFGSRLMANIRENKGYTYNIYSTLDNMRFDGYLYIGTEVGTEFVEPTITEIYNELKILQSHPINESELQMVRNYLLGNFLSMLDGPFNVAEVIRTLLTEGVPFEHFEQLVRSIRNTNSTDLLQLANQYLKPEDMWEVVVGS